jgi:hypothetical protein
MSGAAAAPAMHTSLPRDAQTAANAKARQGPCQSATRLTMNPAPMFPDDSGPYSTSASWSRVFVR